MQPLLTQLLNLPGIEVEDFYDLGDQIIIEVEARTQFATNPSLWTKQLPSTSESSICTLEI